ncbi:MAG: methylated-DNA--[protein]-cysteine S-methyltransferase [bacterium]
MEEECLYYYETILGLIGIRANDNAVTGILLRPQGFIDLRENSLTKSMAQQLREYLAGERRNFTVDISFKGTAFQQEVWRALQTIPYGETRSYSQIAASLGRPRACRAVGGANHCNPLPIVIPCHRVIGRSGSLTGYAGGLELKTRLLELEQKFRKKFFLF